MMTRRAREIGMAKSNFTNPWGRGDPTEKVTPREMALLAAHVIETYPEYYHYFGEKDFTWNKIHQPNRNPLLTMNIGADGLKTGHIAESGFGLVGSAVQNGERLILVINGLRTARERAERIAKAAELGIPGVRVQTAVCCGRGGGVGPGLWRRPGRRAAGRGKAGHPAGAAGIG